jgi:hypothetical protein
VHVGHLGVEDDHIRQLAPGAFQRLSAGERADDRESVGFEGALERPGRPLLIVGDQDEG